jgi:hypothetical protein
LLAPHSAQSSIFPFPLISYELSALTLLTGAGASLFPNSSRKECPFSEMHSTVRALTLFSGNSALKKTELDGEYSFEWH